MNANRLKVIACISMLVDHIGYLLFPHLAWLRWCGRLALPIFAYLLAEGCCHTRSRKRYFLRMLGLGLVCQAVYLAEGLLHGGTSSVLLNILLTLAAAQLVCFAWLDFSDALQRREGQGKAALRLLLTVATLAAVNALGTALTPVIGVTVAFDYGMAGMLLPVFALLTTHRWGRLLTFGIGTVLLCFSVQQGMPGTWFALLSLPLLALYNGQRGSARWKYGFYAFYPLHLAALYGLQFLF